MRFPDDVRHAALSRAALTVLLTAGLSACGAVGGGSHDAGLVSPSQMPVLGMGASNGPRADYPVVVGEPYSIADVEYVPADVLNYDHVGYASLDQGAMGYSGAHHTLPVPSYVEVTSLDTGRTVLVRLERRGPMESNHLVALSPAAMAQLGASAETPVRVRRVNPPETERFALREGEPASLRMDTPASLLTVLQRRLPADGGASLRAENAAPPAAAPQTVEPKLIDSVEIAASDAAIATPPQLDTLQTASADEEAQTAEATVFSEAFAAAEAPQTSTVASIPTEALFPAAEGGFVVQAAAFSTMERAERVADALGGQITQSGRYFRVRTGPFMTRGEAEASLAIVRRAGYSDARILTSG